MTATNQESAPERVTPMPPRRIALTALIFLVIPLLATMASPRRGTGSSIDATAVGVLLVALTLRGIHAWRRRGLRPQPIVDLPILGLAFVATGGADSPFDPALFLVYSLVALFLERDPRRVFSARYVVAYGCGFVVMYGLLFAHVWRAQRSALAEARAPLVEASARVRAASAPLDLDRERLASSLVQALKRLREEGHFAADAVYFDPSQPGGILADFEALCDVLEERHEALAAARAVCDPDRTEDELEATDRSLEAAMASTRERIVLIGARIQAELDRGSASPGAHLPAPDSLSAEINESELLDAALRPLERLDAAQDTAAGVVSKFLQKDLGAFQELEADYADDRRRLLIERSSVAILVLATLALVAGLRAHYEEEARRGEARRTELEMRRKQEETENWIALTAGFTHTIGNDILAYDAFADETLELLGSPSSRGRDLDPRVIRNVSFIRDSNKQRAGFIKFLDEFARMRKLRLEGEAFTPAALVKIDLAAMLDAERAHVGKVEVLDLPEGSSDPRVNHLRRKFADLPLDVRFADGEADPRHITKGRLAVLQFFAYELLKNALRNASGLEPLRVDVTKRDGRVRMRFINDLEIVEAPSPSGAGRIQRLPRLPELAATSDAELRRIVEDVLAHCFEPGRGGGTGLGLFLIRHFVREYYAGSIEAGIHDWSRREVAFEIDVPDDLTGAVPNPTTTAKRKDER